LGSSAVPAVDGVGSANDRQDTVGTQIERIPRPKSIFHILFPGQFEDSFSASKHLLTCVTATSHRFWTKMRQEDRRKDKKRHKKHKHKKSHKRKRSSRSKSSSSSSSDSDVPLSADLQPECGRLAIQAVRQILAHNYDLKADLRTIATKLDCGDALDVSGVEDSYLKERLADFLTALPLIKPTAAFTFLKKSHTVPGSILSFIAPILQEDPDTIKQHVSRLQKQQIDGHHHHDDDHHHQVPIDNIPPPQRDDKAPQAPAQRQQPQPEQQIDTTKQATVKGPAMPPPEYLQAAAAQMQAILPELEEEEHDDEFMVGPPPPDYALDADAPSSDARLHEVVRILAILQEHSSKQPNFGTTTTNSNIEDLVSLPDAYTILGISPDTGASEIKKQYWKLSLLIHPDKCDHPGANTAFQAVTQAAQQLQDAGQRVKVDQQRESVALHKAEVEWRAEQERQRQWRIAKGEATAADLAPPPPSSSSLAGSNSNKRERWMTELPPERAINTRPDPLAMHSTGFSKSGLLQRGDASGWTSTPGGGGSSSEGKHQLEGGGSMRLTTTPHHGPGSGGTTSNVNKSATAAVIDAYNAANRKLSLLEQHQQAAANAEKKKKKKKEKEEKKKRRKTDIDEDDDDEKSPSSSGKHGQHQPAPPPEWRSFDRERDMGPGLGGSKQTSADELMKKLPALDSKFSGGSHQRSFL